MTKKQLNGTGKLLNKEVLMLKKNQGICSMKARGYHKIAMKPLISIQALIDNVPKAIDGLQKPPIGTSLLVMW